MKVVEPTRLMVEAAHVLEPIIEDVVVIGAVAVEVALAGKQLPLTPTRDIDLAVGARDPTPVIRHLQDSGLVPSEAEGERGFSWVRGDLRVQLLARPGPPRMAPTHRLPKIAATVIADRHNQPVAFADSPRKPRFRCATPAALLALKQTAFGRKDHRGRPVHRDYLDALQLLQQLDTELIQEIETSGDPALRGHALKAAEALARDQAATTAAADELLRTGGAESRRAATLEVIRVAEAFLRELERKGF